MVTWRTSNARLCNYGVTVGVTHNIPEKACSSCSLTSAIFLSSSPPVILLFIVWCTRSGTRLLLFLFAFLDGNLVSCHSSLLLSSTYQFCDHLIYIWITMLIFHTYYCVKKVNHVGSSVARMAVKFHSK